MSVLLFAHSDIDLEAGLNRRFSSQASASTALGQTLAQPAKRASRLIRLRGT
jgi:hypothetical protein